ncbi:MAG: molybdopterin-dependent oxidoreductase [Bacillota bacterium]|nr:molybdopterin-dependent oxidoreductase [Bacillota bacterium]
MAIAAAKEPAVITLTIDGRQTAAAQGTTVIEAAAALGIDIPHLCYCPELPSTGSCRLCLVEIEGVRGPVVACKREVAPGMVVRTDSAEIREARRFVVELLLSRHPRGCLTCEASGRCRLQRYAYELGAQHDRFPYEDPGFAVDDANPFIVRDPNLCVLCGRCIRICRLHGAGILEFIYRGLDTKVGTPWDRPLLQSGCDFCGSCVGVCPTGALTEKPGRGRGREWELRKAPSVCNLCGAACAVDLHLKGNTVVRANSPRPTGFLCGRGRFGWTRFSHPERLTAPLVRKGGVLEPVEWEEALEAAARGLQTVWRKWGSGAVGGVLGTDVSREAGHGFLEVMRGGLQTDRIYSLLSFGGLDVLCDLQAVSGGRHAALADVAAADVLLVIGDAVRRAPALWASINRALGRGAKLIYVGPYRGRLARAAAVWLRPRPGMTAVVLQRMAATLLREDGKARLPGRRLDNFADFLATLDTVPEGDPGSGVSEEAVSAAAGLFGDPAARAVTVFAVDGVDRSTARAAVNLALLTGRWERGLHPVAAVANAYGLIGTVPRDGTGRDGTPGAESILSAMERHRAWYVLAEDPVSSFPDPERVHHAMEKADFLVVQDMFLTPTAAMADVVLPASGIPEESGSFTDVAGNPVRFGQAVASAGMPNFQILMEIASHLQPRPAGGDERRLPGKESPLASSPPKAVFLPVGIDGAAGEDSSGLWLVGWASRTGPLFHPRLRLQDFAALEPYGGDYISLAPADGAALGLEEGTEVMVRSPSGCAGTRVKLDEGLERGFVLVSPDTPLARAVMGDRWPLGPTPIRLTPANGSQGRDGDR